MDKELNRQPTKEYIQMTNNNMKEYSISYVLWKLQLNQQCNTTIYLLKQPESKTQCTITLKESLAVFIKLNVLLLYDPTIILLGIYPDEFKTYIHTKTTQIIKAALFIIAKPWKQQCCSVGDWINKLWYSQIVESCLAPKRNELSSHKKMEKT